MISIVCVFNNVNILNNYLLKSLYYQSVRFELICVDNRNNQYKSAAAALNYGANKASGKYIMFVHQDIDLSSHVWLESVEPILDSLDQLGIVGIAGCNGKISFSNADHGNPPYKAGDIRIFNPKQVETIDECLIIIPRHIFDKNKFDESTCNDWHLYAVDYCIYCKQQQLNTYVIPLYVYHLSKGPDYEYRSLIKYVNFLPNGYNLTLKRILYKYKNYKIIINTTCGSWNTSYPIYLQQIYSYIYRHFL